jgi:hypothetical protein
VKPVGLWMAWPKEYRAWHNMKNRCFNPRIPAFRNYGGRGITVCLPWEISFAQFFSDIGPAPSRRHTLGRVNNDGNYEPGNVRWETWTEQQKNRRKPSHRVIRGHVAKPGDAWRSQQRRAGWVTLADASAETGIATSTLRSWVAAGKLQSKKVGGILFVSDASLEAMTSGKAAP